VVEDDHAEIAEEEDQEVSPVVAEDELVGTPLFLFEVVDDVIEGRGELGDPLEPGRECPERSDRDHGSGSVRRPTRRGGWRSGRWKRSGAS
jgi:hypothetical protein